MILSTAPHPIPSLFHINRHKQKPTIAQLFSYLRSQYTLFAKISLFSHPSIHPTMALQIWSDRTAVYFVQYNYSSENNDTNEDRRYLVLLHFTCMSTSFSSLFLCLYMDITSYQMTSYSTTEFQQTIDFLLTYFNDSNGVGTSTSCFCLNYHNFLHLHRLPFNFQSTVENTNISFPSTFELNNKSPASAKK